MNPGKTLLLLQFLLCAATAAAQSVAVRFRVTDRATRTERPRIRLPWSREGDSR